MELLRKRLARKWPKPGACSPTQNKRQNLAHDTRLQLNRELLSIGYCECRSPAVPKHKHQAVADEPALNSLLTRSRFNPIHGEAAHLVIDCLRRRVRFVSLQLGTP